MRRLTIGAALAASMLVLAACEGDETIDPPVVSPAIESPALDPAAEDPAAEDPAAEDPAAEDPAADAEEVVTPVPE